MRNAVRVSLRWPSLAARLAPALAGAVVAGATAGCGFQLEGHTPLPAVVRNLYVEAPDRQSDFVQNLRHALLSNGANLMQDRTKASAVVSILRDDVARRVLSVSALNQPIEYEVTYTVGFSVTAGDQEVLPAQEVTAIRTYSFDERLLLAKGHEEDILRRDMARDLAERVMRSLSSL
jgi:LPS-assembly lipoprotein